MSDHCHPSPVFLPSPGLATKVVDALSNPTLCFRDIALAHDTSVEALSAWISRDDIQRRLLESASGAAAHARYLASLHVSAAISAAVIAMEHTRLLLEAAPALDSPSLIAIPSATSPPNHAANPSLCHAATSPPPSPPLRALEFRRRLCETARLSASVILRIARFVPVTAAPRDPAASPAAKGGTERPRPVPEPPAATGPSIGAGGTGATPVYAPPAPASRDHTVTVPLRHAATQPPFPSSASPGRSSALLARASAGPPSAIPP